MTLKPRFLLITTILITTLSGCEVSKKNEIGTSGNYYHSPLAPAKMLQPERFLLNGIRDPFIPSPKQILGLVSEEVHKMLGVPDFKHYDPPAEIWQYRKDRCLLDVFLYADKHQPNVLRVRHAEARSRNINKISQKKCFLRALRAKR